MSEHDAHAGESDSNELAVTQTSIAEGATLPSLPDAAEGRAPQRPRHVLSPGAVLSGCFEVLRPLGSGGMGEVFLARDRRLGRRVASKTLRLPERLPPSHVRRFAQLFNRDAASTAQLNHPHIVTIHQVGEAQGVSFMALEYVEGTPLDVWLREHGPMDELSALSLLVQLCDALGYAHERGVVHRDIKPANLMRDRDGRLKVLDFGVALIRREQAELEESFGVSSHELEEHLGDAPRAAGTAAYMPPEQRMGLAQDERVDIWAAGITAFELLTGHRPKLTDGGSFTPSWPHEPQISALTMLAIEGCLKIAPRARTSSALALKQELSESLDALSVAPLSERRPRRLLTIQAPRDEFVGRGAELERLGELFDTLGAQMVTLVGPGGVGKTRLAAQWGSSVGGHVVLCPLAEVVDREGVVHALGRALDVPLTQKDPELQLRWVLERHPLIVILDTCEHLLEPLGELVDQWLREVPTLKVLATSRSPLSIVGERVMPVAPMEALTEAVQLFTVRARSAVDGWTCPEGERVALEELVRQLDGLPLALELAAARARILSPAQLLARMSQRFVLLRSSRRRGSSSSRRATLDGALRWSWDLLEEPERHTLMHIATFEGGFTLEAAEDVVDLSGLEGAPFVFDALGELVDASLVRRPGEDGRFSMLASVQAFASERAREAGVHEQAHARHARWAASLCPDELFLRAKEGAAERVEREGQNLAAAASWSLRQRDERVVADGLRCIAGSAWLIERQGPYSRLEPLLELVAGHHGDHDTLERALAHYTLGKVQWLRGQLDDAAELVGLAREGARRLDARLLEVASIGLMGTLHSMKSEVDEARGLYEAAASLAEELGEQEALSTWLGNLGNLEVLHGRTKAGEDLLERALEHAQRAGDVRLEGVWFGRLGSLAWMLGRLGDAKDFMNRALEVALELGDRRMMSVELGNLAMLEHLAGHFEVAKSMHKQVVEVAGELGDRSVEAVALGNIGLLEKELGDLDAAVRLTRSALRITEELDEVQRQVIHRTNLGDMARELGDLSEAKGLLGRALEDAERIGDRLGVLYALASLGMCASQGYEHAEGVELLERASGVAVELGLSEGAEVSSTLKELAEALGVPLPVGIFEAP